MSGSEQDTMSDGEETAVPATKTTRRSKPQPSSIIQNLTYVEEAIPKFSGTDPTYTVSKWAQEIEDNTIIFGLTPVQKLLIARRTLTATAASWLRTERPFPSYEELKKAISKEFPDFINTKKIHEIMSKRIKRKDESYYEYMLEMKALGKRGRLTDSVAIEYIVDGIKDLETNKVVLYGTKTFSELKERIKIYESLKQKQHARNNASASAGPSASANATNINSRRNQAAVRCYSCGQFNHTSAECPQRDKGRKCFRCNEFGHIGSQCSASATSDKKRSSYVACQCADAEVSQDECQDGDPKDNIEENVLSAVSCEVNVNVKSDSLGRHVNNITKNKSVKEVIINGINVMCLVDSGSDLNLISSDLFFQLGVTKFERDNVTLSGFGDNNRVCSFGRFDISIELDGQNFVTTLHIVPHCVMPYELILGQEFLNSVVVIIRQGKVTVIPPLSDNTLWASQVCCSTAREEPNTYLSDPTIRNDIQEMVKNYVPIKTKDCPIELKIILTDDIPVAQRPRRLSIKEEEEVDKQIGEWLEQGIIRPSFSEYASPLVLVKKKDGGTRICIDYRKINRKMIKDEFPLPIIEDHIDKLSKVKIFSKIDLKNAFFHLNVSPESIKYTSFVTPTSQYEFLKAPFGLSICPKYFTRFINIIFQDLVAKKFLLIFIDDLIIMSNDYHEGLERLREVLKVASDYGLEVNWKKCELLTTCVEYLGHTIENGTVRPTDDKIKAVMNFPEPKTLKQLHSFIGLTSYFRKYIRNYASVAAPLTDLLKKSQTFQFTDVQRQAFNHLKQRLCEQPVLSIFQLDLPTELHTDASMYAYSAILLQRRPEDEKLHPIYYSSCKTTEAERKYTSYELEALAVIQGVKKFRKYLLGIPFKIVTDCSAFEMTLRKKDLVTRVARWALLLQEYDYTVEHRSGSKMRHVDALSRNPDYIGVVTRQMHEQIRTAQRADEGLKAIIDIVETRPYLDYFIENGLLYKTSERLMVIPTSLENEIIKRIHGIGHFSKRKMIDSINKDYYIKDLPRKVEDFILTCIPCILATRKEGKQEGFLRPIDKGDSPLQTLHLDHVGPMTETRKQYNYILTVVNAFTKFTWLFPTKTTSTREVLSKLEIHQQVFGNPERFITDRGAAFTSNDFKEYCDREEILHTKITTGIPRGNGQVERIHRTVISILTKLCIEKPDQWYRHVSQVQRALNSTWHRSIDCSPYELMIGRKMKMKDDIKIYELLQQEGRQFFSEERESLRQKAQEQILQVQEENQRNFNKRRKESMQYQKGDLVAIKRTQFGTGMKLKPKFLGPYRVEKPLGNDRYEVVKVGVFEGPNKTSTAADFMKKMPDGFLV